MLFFVNYQTLSGTTDRQTICNRESHGNNSVAAFSVKWVYSEHMHVIGAFLYLNRDGRHPATYLLHEILVPQLLPGPARLRPIPRAVKKETPSRHQVKEDRPD